MSISSATSGTDGVDLLPCFATSSYQAPHHLMSTDLSLLHQHISNGNTTEQTASLANLFPMLTQHHNLAANDNSAAKQGWFADGLALANTNPGIASLMTTANASIPTLLASTDGLLSAAAAAAAAAAAFPYSVSTSAHLLHSGAENIGSVPLSRTSTPMSTAVGLNS
jgi:hypothetical protein